MDRSPLLESVINGDLEKLESLVSGNSNVDINAQDENGWSCLHFAAQKIEIEIGRFLINHGALIDLQDNYGNTPLWRATFESRGDCRFISLLLDQGANKDLKNNSGISPLDLSKTIANYDLAKCF